MRGKAFKFVNIFRKLELSCPVNLIGAVILAAVVATRELRSLKVGAYILFWL